MATSSYPKIIALGDKQIVEIFDGPVEITEKVDGSQFGFGMVDGKLVCRSKGKEQDLDNPDKMFKEGVEYVRSIENRLPDDIFFYSEYLQKPRHSTLAYNAIPKNHIVIFGGITRDQQMLTHAELGEWANKFEVDVIPLVHEGDSGAEHVLSLMERESYLGGQNIEGLVVKRSVNWLWLGKIVLPVMAGKYVSEKFKETHQKDWSKLNTGKGQLEALKEKYTTVARWMKGVMHLKEQGKFLGAPQDIGPLIKEVQLDLVTEEETNIKDDLYKLFGGDIIRAATSGIPNWYKESLLKGEL